ncbi:hypothetical protein AHMF7605_20895 [Adhaeribacter arboris]|uniref:Uncharacterized protein n=1 Tax=Adhaeribacter arboris TaxID=2072846 RepID=A0A2T2YJV1_9BACT|nr:hypothetical protein [Adhaeribacter arboris]PSR55780.1 hypothetical protein AHMF7605_20895 [Adhaeribacter arboris]
MAADTILANPFLIRLWKNLWLLSQYGDLNRSFTSQDYDIIARYNQVDDHSSANGEEFLKKILRADTQIKFFKRRTLDKLCKTLSLKVSYYNLPNSWKSFEESQVGHKTFRDCQLLVARRKSIQKLDKALIFRINKHAKKKAEYMLHFDASEFNVPTTNFEDLKREIQIATEEDIEKIYDFARNGRYKNCPVNGPVIKVPWWRQNPFIFYVIKDNQDKVIANINILPLTEESYFKIRNGVIDERGIKHTDLHQPNDKYNVSYLYIEGFNCMTTALMSKFIFSFLQLIDRIADISNPNLVIGAIGGTDEGEELMTKLGFEIVSFAEVRQDSLDFYELPLNKAIWLRNSSIKFFNT